MGGADRTGASGRGAASARWVELAAGGAAVCVLEGTFDCADGAVCESVLPNA